MAHRVDLLIPARSAISSAETFRRSLASLIFSPRVMRDLSVLGSRIFFFFITYYILNIIESYVNFFEHYNHSFRLLSQRSHRVRACSVLIPDRILESKGLSVVATLQDFSLPKVFPAFMITSAEQAGNAPVLVRAPKGCRKSISQLAEHIVRMDSIHALPCGLRDTPWASSHSSRPLPVPLEKQIEKLGICE